MRNEESLLVGYESDYDMMDYFNGYLDVAAEDDDAVLENEFMG